MILLTTVWLCSVMLNKSYMPEWEGWEGLVCSDSMLGLHTNKQALWCAQSWELLGPSLLPQFPPPAPDQ